MSNTRHTTDARALSQERYMSSPEYAELRGISGNAVTAKAALMAHPQKRSLLFFLQAMSLREGGLKKFCREFLEAFPDRIGTPTMHREGVRPGKKYDAHKIRCEISPSRRAEFNKRIVANIMIAEACGDQPPSKKNTLLAADEALAECRKELSHLEGFIIELCINPKLQFSAPGESVQSLERERRALQDNFPEIHRSDMGLANEALYESAEHPCFKDIVPALFEYKRGYEETIRREFVVTEVSRKTFETLDVALATGKMVIVEGNSRIGKTTATEAWCSLHLGEARFISLSGITHKTGFFRSLARVLGIGGSYARSSTEMQTRVEDMLQRSKLILVIDEAHHLFSAAERVYSRPELVDWLNTACYNHSVPTACICTPQFAVRMARVEKQTTWNADQFRGRVKRFCTLPAKPTSKDLEAVARKLLPSVDSDTVRYVVGYALTSKLNMSAVVDAVDEAKLLAARAGREKVKFEDVEKAIGEYCAKSSEAMARSFSPQIVGKQQGAKRPRALPAPDEAPETDGAGLPLHPRDRGARKTNLTGLVPIRNLSGGRGENGLTVEAA